MDIELTSAEPARRLWPGTRVSVGCSKDCQREVFFGLSKRRLPESRICKELTGEEKDGVDQTMVPSGRETVRPEEVSLTTPELGMGKLRLADQMIVPLSACMTHK